MYLDSGKQEGKKCRKRTISVCSACPAMFFPDSMLLTRCSARADLGTKEAAEKWGVSQSLVQRWCRRGKILNATQDEKGYPWHMPSRRQKR